MWLEIISRLSPFIKVKFKVIPIERGSHFKIHFSLGFWGNRGSSQKFHGAPFSRDRKIIIPSHATTPISYYTCSNIKFNKCMYEKRRHEKIALFIPKYEIRR